MDEAAMNHADLPPLFPGGIVAASTPLGTVTDHWPCPSCDRVVEIVHRPGRPRLYCSHACRQRAYRWRHRHRAHTVATPERPAEAARARSFVRGGHALRSSADPLARRRDRCGREVTVCGLLASPMNHVRARGDRAPFLQAGSTSCRVCAALVQPRPTGLVPPDAMPPPWRWTPGRPDPLGAQLRAISADWPLDDRLRQLAHGLWR